MKLPGDRPAPAGAPTPPAFGLAARRGLRRAYLAWVVVVLAGLAGGLWLIVEDQRAMQRQRLPEVAQARAQMVEDWLQQTLDFCAFMHRSSAMRGLWTRWTEHGDAASGETLTTRMVEFRRAAGFASVTIADADGRTVWSEAGGNPVDTGEREFVAAVARAGQARFGRLHQGGPLKTDQHLDLVLPVGVGEGGATFVALMRADPARRLGRLLEKWPVPSRTAEFVLWERQGEDLVALLPLRHRGSREGPLQLPVAGGRSAAAQALRGELGLGQVTALQDYRGVTVLAAAAPVEGSAFVVEAKIDRSEWLAPAFPAAAWAGAVALLALTGGLLVLRHQGQRAALRELQAERAAESMRMRTLAMAQAVADGSADAIFAKDLQGRYILFNGATGRLAGLDPQRALGHTDDELFGPDVAARYREDDRLVLEHGETRSFEESVRLPGGQRHVLTTKGPLRDSNGELIGSYGIARDVTDERNARDAMAQSERLFRAVTENAADAFFAVQAGGPIIAVNQAACRDTGYTRDELLALKVWDIGPEIRPERMPGLRERMERDGPLHFDTLLRRKDGSTYQAEVRLTLMRVDGQQLALAFAHDLTERLAAQAALAESRGRLQLALESSGMGAWDYDIARDTFRWSPEVYQLMHLEAPENAFSVEQSSSLVFDGIVAEDRERVRSELRAALDGNGRFVSEFRVGRSDGSVQWVLDIGRVQYDPQGRPQRLIGTVQDIDARKAAEAELLRHRQHLEQLVDARTHELADALAAREQGEDFLRMVTDALPGLVSYWSVDMVCRFANRYYLQWLGRPLDAVIGHSLAELLPPERLAYNEPLITRALTGESVVTDYAGPDPVTLEPRFMVAHFIPDLRDGVCAGVLFVAHDVTARRAAELQTQTLNDQLSQALHAREESEAFLRMVTEALPSSVTYWSMDEVCRFANHRELGWIDRPREQVIGRRLPELLGAERMAALRPLVARALGGETVVAEVLGQEPGRAGDGHFVVHLIPDLRQGVQQGFLFVANDVTELKGAQGALERANVELAEARNRADAANQAKSAFLANMSHEIRTPLNAVTGMAHLVVRDTVDPVVRERVTKIAEAARHLLTLINDILDLSKIESGRLELEQVDFSLEAVLSRATAMAGEAARRKGLELVVDVGDAPDGLRGDPMRLAQALINLLSNAVKFTAQGWVCVRVECLERRGSAVQLAFSVRDTGVGIPRASLDGLFEAFAQADASTTRRFGGTGLGLAISRRLVEMMGGEIGVESEPGVGSQFRFTAWLQVAEGGLSRLEDAQVGLAAQRALLVDSLPASRGALARLLTAEGLTLDAAGDAASALERVGRARDLDDPYRLLLIDSRLPDLEGVELGRRIRAATPNLAARLVLLSVQDDPALRAEAALAGFDAVWLKPLLPSDLQAALAALTQGLVAAPTPQPTNVAARLRERHGGARVLLAEDNPINQQVAAEMLEGVGLQVSLAGNGHEVLERAAAEPVDLVLMDVQMPEMDGLEAARRLRAQPEHAHTPIIAMTAGAFEEDRAACLAAGMDAYITKPTEPAALFEMLLRLLDHSRGEAADTQPASLPPSEVAGEADGGAPAEGAITWRLALQGLAGIDVDAALRHFGADAAALWRALVRFAAHYRPGLPELAQALRDGRSDDAVQALHSLKDAAAAVAARGLEAEIAALERRLQEGGTAPPPTAERVQAALASVVAAVGAREAALQAVRPGASAVARQALEVLRDMLRTGDFGTVNVWARFEPSMLAHHGDRARAIGRCIRAFEHEAALGMLEALASDSR